MQHIQASALALLLGMARLVALLFMLPYYAKQASSALVPERAGPLEASTPSSASVFLKFQKGYGVESVVVPVRALVANGIPGLSQDRVAVVLVPAAGAEASGQSAALSKVLFMRVGQESVAALWTLLGVLGAAILGGIAWGVRFLIRLRQDGVAL